MINFCQNQVGLSSTLVLAVCRFPIMRWLLLLLIPLMSGVCGAAITVLPADDFTTGKEGWRTGGANPNPPAIVGNGGASGTAVDPYLTLSSNGTTGAGGRLVVFNRDQWAGDYTMAGITGVEVSFLNVNRIALDIRVALNGAGGRFATSDAVRLLPLAPWTRATFSLQAADLVSSGGTDVALTLANVTELRILHQPSEDFVSIVSLASLGIDRIHAIPEPTTSVFLIFVGFLVRFRRVRA